MRPDITHKYNEATIDTIHYTGDLPELATNHTQRKHTFCIGIYQKINYTLILVGKQPHNSICFLEFYTNLILPMRAPKLHLFDRIKYKTVKY